MLKSQEKTCKMKKKQSSRKEIIINMKIGTFESDKSAENVGTCDGNRTDTSLKKEGFFL